MVAKILTYAKKRHIVYLFLTIFVLILPFINVNGIHLFLLSFEHKNLELGFVRFDMQELYLMPFLFILLFLFIFFITTLAGRVWCGWSCPQTIFRYIYRDIIQTKIFGIYKSSANRQKQVNKPIFIHILAVLFFVPIAFIAACNFMWYFIPPFEFFSHLKEPFEYPITTSITAGIAAWLIFDITILKEKFCIYSCPYARIQSVMFDSDTMQVIYDTNRGGVVYEDGVKLFKKPREGECTGCEACVRICPTHIDIRKGMQLECINCLECADACSKTMASFNLPSLISWSSANAVKTKQKIKLMRFRTVAYLVILAVAFSALVLMSEKKENMLLNINRTSELYNITDDNKVQNSYLFLFQNTDDKPHTYYFDIQNPDLNVIKPKEPFVIQANQKRRIIVTIQSDKFQGKEEQVQIHAYATDDKERINIKRNSIFIYPKETK